MSSSTRAPSPSSPGVTVHRPRDLLDLKPVLRQRVPTTNVLRLLCDLGAVDPGSVSEAVGHIVTSHIASPVALRQRHRAPRAAAAATVCRRSGERSTSGSSTASRSTASSNRRCADCSSAIGCRRTSSMPVAGPYEVDFSHRRDSQIVLECDGWEYHAKTPAQQAHDATRAMPDLDRSSASSRCGSPTARSCASPAQASRAGSVGIIRRWAPHLWSGRRHSLGSETEHAQTPPRAAKHSDGSGGVVGVDADVAVGEVAAPHGARGVAGAERDVDADLVAARGTRTARRARRRRPASGRPPGRRSG